MSKWFGLFDGDIRYIGEFAGIQAADEATNYEALWLIHEDTAREWRDKLSEHLG